VPGSLTGIFQVCNVGIQRVLKLALHHFQLEDVGDETTSYLDAGSDPLKLKLETKIGVLRNQSIGWFTKTYHEINKPKLIMHAWEHCKAGPFDLSFASLTSLDAFCAYSQLRETDPKLWAELNVDASEPDSASKSDFLEESNE
jgi:hypothetical protein